MGPQTKGYDELANLPPSMIDLHSFGYASVSEDDVLTVKLMCINGAVMYEKTLEPPSAEETVLEGNKAGGSHIVIRRTSTFVYNNYA